MKGYLLLCTVFLASMASCSPLRGGYSVLRDPKTSFDVCGSWDICESSGSSTSATSYVFHGKKGEFPDKISLTYKGFSLTDCKDENLNSYVRYEFDVTTVETIPNEDTSKSELVGTWVASGPITAIYVRITDPSIVCEGIEVGSTQEYDVTKISCTRGSSPVFTDYKEQVETKELQYANIDYGNGKLYSGYNSYVDTSFTRQSDTGCSSSNVGMIVGIVIGVVVVIVIIVVVIILMRKKDEPEVRMPTTSKATETKKKAEAKAATEASAPPPAAADPVPVEATPEPAPAAEPAPVATPEPAPTAEPAPVATPEPAPTADPNVTVVEI